MSKVHTVTHPFLKEQMSFIIPSYVMRTMQLSLKHKFPDAGWWRLGVGLASVDLKAEAKRVFQTALTLEPRYAYRHPFR